MILRRVTEAPAAGAFRYFDKGTMAVVGQGYAVLQSGNLQLKQEYEQEIADPKKASRGSRAEGS